MTNLKLKHCPDCKSTLPIEDFHKNKATKDGLNNICKVCNGARAKRWREANPEKHKEHQYQRKYGLSYEDYQGMLEVAGGVCEICKKTPEESPRGVLFVDHCHKTSKVRGLLCQNCNTTLGLMEDRVDLLSSAKDYLQKENTT